jgi:hypothetical protein
MEDFQQLHQQDQTITVWGEVATFRFDVDTNFQYMGALEEQFLLEEANGELQLTIAAMVERRLGPQLEARLEIRPGSVIVLVIIEAVRAVYESVAEYENFKQGLSQLSSDIKNAVAGTSSRVVPDQFTINSALTPGSALLHAEAIKMFNDAASRIR